VSKGSDLDRVTYIVLQEMRGPIFILVMVYTIGIAGMVLMPGPVVDGETTRMSFFHAFYFMAYTATTTGFGELPLEFSEPQRMWTIFCLYLSVVAWIYAIGAIIRLVQNPYFTQALAQRRFARSVARIHTPFVIICGFGDTGSLLARGLNDRRVTGVIIDADQERIKALALRDYDVKMPGLCADASVPKNLQDAGIERDNCIAVVVLTEEELSLKIAVMTHLLNPKARLICRSTSHAHDAELSSLGSVVIADPFESFARQLSLALSRPALHTLDEWLVGARGVQLSRPIECPHGKWMLCGYGRMGKWLQASLKELEIHTTIIDPMIDESDGLEHYVVGPANADNLRDADVEHCAGVIAGTDSDATNLAVLLTARNLNPNVFLVVRQNYHENELAFQAANADLIMQPSLVTARRILLNLISPLVGQFLAHLEAHPDMLISKVYPRLLDVFDDEPPWLWTIELNAGSAPSAVKLLDAGCLDLQLLLTHPDLADRTLPCVPLMVRRDGAAVVMPEPTYVLGRGDELLLCGHVQAQPLLDATLTNPYTLEALYSGEEPSRSRLLGMLR
jgi:Trk K+ transport system NAD-binding subunit